MFRKTVALIGGVLLALLVYASVGAFPFWGSGQKDDSKNKPQQNQQLTQNAPQAAPAQSTPAPAGQPEPGEVKVIPSSFAPLVKRVMPTVVNVAVTQKVKGFAFGVPFGGGQGGPGGGGQGGGGGGGGGGGEDEPSEPNIPNAPPSPFGGGSDPFEQFRRFFGEVPHEFKQ